MKKNLRAWIPDKKDPKLIRLLSERNYHSSRISELDLRIKREVSKLAGRSESRYYPCLAGGRHSFGRWPDYSERCNGCGKTQKEVNAIRARKYRKKEA